MQVIGIKELQTNPGKLSSAFNQQDYALITKHGKPFGVALPFTDSLMEHGLKPWYAIKGFQNGDLSLGQLSKTLEKTHHETIKLLGLLGVAIADYDLEEDLGAIDKIMDL
jgi:predicted HTH domain antitoxin